jgi:hypothetical protein
MKSLRFFFFIIFIFIALIFCKCENKERFYRPNLPEELCSIGIIDADDTTRYISFEKSYQVEYPEDDSLRNLSFTISGSSKELFKYQSDQTIKNLLGLKLPDSIEFNSGEMYSLIASENGTPNISAEVTVPDLPSQLTLNSISKEITTLQTQNECVKSSTSKSAIINLSFINNNGKKQYYALLVEAIGGSGLSSLYIPQAGLLDFTVRETNYPGFFAEMHGLTMYHYMCNGIFISVIKSPVFGYFIDGSRIADKICNITLTTQFNDSYSIYDFIKGFRIKLLSIPEELYLFEKSLYTYEQNAKDPFSEPVYLIGNIKGGNGVFAICRSSTLSINLSQWY